ncbi:MAG: hypothetical protein R2853_06205 [Thermomicrobiales bacterium]
MVVAHLAQAHSLALVAIDVAPEPPLIIVNREQRRLALRFRQ